VIPNQDKSYELVKRCYTLFDELSDDYQEQLQNYGLPPNSSFVHLWLAQAFESAEQIYQGMKYDDENIPFDKCVKVLGWNSSRFDIALLWDALDCELWSMSAPIGNLNNTKSITVTHKKSHMKLQFIDAENLFGPMTLKACVKDYEDKSEHKDVFPYEIINSCNWKDVLVKAEPFEYEDFKSQLKRGYSISKDEYDQYLIDFKRFTNRLEHLKYYNINDTEIMVKPLMNLIDTFEQFNINELTYDEQSNKVISQNNENVTTHVFALDGNSLYPRSYSSVKNENIPCTDHRIYMRKDIFIAKVKGYFPKSEHNNLLALPPIFRNIEIENKEEVIDLGFIITDYKAIAVFEKNAAYEPFVRTMMILRIQAILAGSTKEKFYKLIINSSYGYDTLNTEKFGKIKMLDKAGTFIAQHHPNHMGTKRISANTFAVQIKPKTANCFISIHSGVFTLDNAKYWYLNYIYYFMYKCLDGERFHFVLADTDSIYISTARDKDKYCQQQFESIVTDKKFYDQHVYQYLPNHNKDIYDYKKKLGFGFENE
ncbi:MAG: hypothetical protein EZS28_000273, partial [Streblomastix strix]